MKRSVANSKDMMIIIAVTDAIDSKDNGYYEQIAIGYNTNGDNYEAIILSCGNGCGDDRVLCDDDSDETINPDVLDDSANWVRNFAADAATGADHPHAEELFDLADYIDHQAEFLRTR